MEKDGPARSGFRRLCAFRLSGRGRAGRRGGRDRPWFRRPKLKPPQSRRHPNKPVSLLACRALERHGLRRFPERREGQGHWSGGQGRFSFGRTSQALHHARHGDGSRQIVQSSRPRHFGRKTRQEHSRNRRDDFPSALVSGGSGAPLPVIIAAAIFARRGSRRPMRWPRNWARCLSRRGRGCAPPIFRARAKRIGRSQSIERCGRFDPASA